ncbi:FAR-17a/AIG1-like protein [Mycena floridula]|nr:FAR-17a/AIG1-like protein [Mycena floridula]
MGLPVRLLARSLLHGSAAAIMAYGYIGLESLVLSELIETQYGGHFQFLTIQGLAISFVVMVLAFLGDVTAISALVTLKRALFMIALPVEVVVSTIYWPLMIFLPSLILRSVDSEPSSSSEAPIFARIPLKLDLAMHASPALALLLDFILFEKSYSRREVGLGATCVTLAATSWYGFWVERCASINGSFPYPFLDTEFPLRLAIYFSAGLLALFSFRLLNNLHLKLYK